MKTEPADDQAERIEFLLRRYSCGELDRRLVMRRLDVSYSELLQMLHERDLDLPSVSAADAELMANELDAVLNQAAH